MLSVPLDRQRRLRVSEYHRMIEAGVFQEDERLELLGGVIVRMSPPQTAFTRHRAEQFQPLFAPSVVIEVSEIKG